MGCVQYVCLFMKTDTQKTTNVTRSLTLKLVFSPFIQTPHTADGLGGAAEDGDGVGKGAYRDDGEGIRGGGGDVHRDQHRQRVGRAAQHSGGHSHPHPHQVSTST